MGRCRRLGTIFFIMAKIGLFTFGGGWSIIAQMQNEFVDKRHWMTEEQVVDYMSLAKSFPGVMIINMSVFCGYAMAGVSGAAAAAVGLSAPALVSIALVTYFYSSLRDNVWMEKILCGVRSVVVPIIISACLKLRKTAIQGRSAYMILAVTFVICVLSEINKLLVVGAALIAGLLIWRGEIPDDLS
ncbi:chromate transporter [bacterium D16-54]|nr:chromate transporter [bacterium D16-54]RKJ15923.1 chromate transporter [bacterium D16-56]